MIAAPHMIVGAIIGDLIQNCPLAFLAGMGSHFIFDAIPHLEQSVFMKKEDVENFRLSKKMLIFEFFEVFVGLLLVFWIFFIKDRNLAILWGALGAIFPDLIDNVPFWSLSLRRLPVFKQFHWFHSRIHSPLKKKYWIFGVPVYIIIIGIAVWIFRK